MKYLTTAIYTVYSPLHRAHCECRKSFERPYCLTFKGVERLLKKECVDRNLIRVEHATLNH